MDAAPCRRSSGIIRMTIAPVIRIATPEDLADFYGEIPRFTHRAYAAVLDGKTIGIAGLIYQRPGAPPYFFADMKEEGRRFPKTLIRGAQTMLAAFGRPGIPAIADPDERCSAKLLRHLGFVSAGPSAQGEVFVYRGRP